jgi:prepilin signal peptidase PulO-like enzyme (type II secretory pathway)
LTGVIFLFVFFKIASSAYVLGLYGSLAALLFFWFAFSVLIVIAVYDIKHKIVPDMAVFVLAIASLLFLVLSHEAIYFGTLSGMLDLFSGVILFLPFFFLWYGSKGAWMGLGDGKLALAFGWMLGFVNAVSAIILGFWIAALFALTVITIQKFRKSKDKYTGKTEIPFAPFLVAGALLAFYFAPDILSLRAILSI